ncbi:MurR/RpiR family transcriptional regulator [Falsibacillus albus]|uniref:MurR/RpiR family transcriptional regulator n=1 Tax=Falsibacillus albus TaxID=2478915 RepID=A0A3L7JX42_9BACI|nr:MurR/RpiR family transcriptional regulator [Falsibacillus albus]RLQ94895.1 MurR/RpiR family transcriptional regulator [Falsibacillus albus]
MGKVLEQFASYIKELTHSERHVLYYIEGNIDQAKNQSLTDMARVNSVSTTTIVRMCHKLGLEGFTELKFLLKKMESDSRPEASDAIDRYRREMDQALSSLKVKDFEEISEQLMRADRIMIVGVGLSKMMGEYFSKLFMQTNKPTSYVYESHIIDLLPNMVQPKDLIVFLSSSGETSTIVQAAEKLRYKNVDTLAITNGADSTLSKSVRKTLSADIQRVQYAGYDLSARSSMVMLIDILFEYYLKKIK